MFFGKLLAVPTLPSWRANIHKQQGTPATPRLGEVVVVVVVVVAGLLSHMLPATAQ
jgi:hypothetical protein